MELRRQVERVAAQRRALPPGGEIPEDYVFEAAGASGKPKRVRLSELLHLARIRLRSTVSCSDRRGSGRQCGGMAGKQTPHVNRKAL